MAIISINIEKAIIISQQLATLAKEINGVYNTLNSISLAGILEDSSRNRIERSINLSATGVLNEAAKTDSLSSALQTIAEKYRAIEKEALNRLNSMSAMSSEVQGNNSSEEKGTDKRNWWIKFWDWVFRNEPDEYDTTSDEQEKAADEAMKKQLWQVLQDDKYSQANWDHSSIEERKQILQDYMNDIIRIYGLKHVKANINWDSSATYTSTTITWGYYTHDYHTITLNERALSDSIKTWDSYELLETVSHELRHAYQHEAIDHPTDYLVSQETISTWDDNFDKYIRAEKDYIGYRNQPVEVDARDFQVSRDDHY